MPETGRLVIVSNRLPAGAAPDGQRQQRDLPIGGLVTALSSALEKRESLWVGWSGEVVERASDRSPRLSAIGGIRLAGVELTRYEANLFYNGFCNRILWPLLHSFPTKMIIRHDAYGAYLRTNHKYAQVVASLLKDDDVVWVHDFHLLPLASELRRLGWQGKIGAFLHTPFPPAEIFAVLPWATQILDMLLDYDLFGVHTRRYLNNLFDSLSTELHGVVIGQSFIHGDRKVRAGAWPIGIDSGAFERMAISHKETPTGTFLRGISPAHQIVLGVDRLDYTKGVVQRLLTFEHLLEHYPRLRGRVTLVQISAPSRTRVPEYVEERQQVDQLVGSINGRFSDAAWVPVRYIYRSLPQEELAAFYREAAVGLVTPLRDGMNLVAKEFVAAQGDDPGVIVLSKFCGAADIMKQALIVNPYDIEGVATAIHRALTMSRRERTSRWEALIQDIRTYSAEAWSDSFLDALASSPSLSPTPR